jgi:uncharacterized protein YtpQ (UPF0354 family)
MSWLQEILKRKPSLLGAPSDIVPIIKVSTSDDASQTLKLPPDETPVVEHLVADLLVLYGFDLPRFFSLLTPHDCGKLGLPKNELRALAIANLRRRLPRVECVGKFPAFMLRVGGNYEASLLLLEEVWETQKQLVCGDLVAAVPSREVLVFTGCGSPDGIAAIRGSIERTFQHASHLLSKTLLLWRGKEWAPYEG